MIVNKYIFLILFDELSINENIFFEIIFNAKKKIVVFATNLEP